MQVLHLMSKGNRNIHRQFVSNVNVKSYRLPALYGQVVGILHTYVVKQMAMYTFVVGITRDINKQNICSVSSSFSAIDSNKRFLQENTSLRHSLMHFLPQYYCGEQDPSSKAHSIMAT